ncbi:glyoxylase-like metal-dependent hydrolase (beta-lactamase superfamily II) [Spirosoma oryzae]|uniref:Glyoxylase-like metal-dependent hydrolase (Beta-lactamase superfamily II) n=1 Tax=Spirosoma oryzae TaxID=1469603 RepID=A0A2T0T0F9_9BACT|nr:MBL fold metallo-hydrolase [Spirosoma oryzae]PRY39141.1 glyoxylase-like metal-dependent hydrolase (beta-lactamase superfamily II) [Spirosoma oryzae]
MIQAFEFSPFSENTYVIADDVTRDAVIIDPGCYEQAEKEALSQFITSNQLNVRYLLLTHAHLDHVFGVAYVKRKYNVKAYLHELDQVIYNDVPTRCAVFGLRGYEPSEIDAHIKEGDQIKFGSIVLDVVFVPGHAPGHVAYINHAERYVVGGDVLFQRSIGRTDFPYSNHADLVNSIRTEFYTLPDDYTVYAGHGEPTTIGQEKRANPFVRP